MDIDIIKAGVEHSGYNSAVQRIQGQRESAANPTGGVESAAGLSGAVEGDFASRLFSKEIKIDKNDKLYEQCEALETFLLKSLVSSMRKTVDKSGLIDGGFAGEMYDDMLWDEYAKDFSKNAGFGFAELAYLELTGQRGKVLNRAM